MEYEKFPLFAFHKSLFEGISIRNYEQRAEQILHDGLINWKEPIADGR